MKRIYRSIINIKKSGALSIPMEDLAKNYKAFLASRIKPEEPSYIKMYHWIEAHYRQFRELPAVELLYERAQADGDEAILANLKDIIVQTPYTRSDYQVILKEKFEEQSKTEFYALIQRTHQAVTTGIEVGTGKKKKKITGIAQAIEFFSSESRKFRLDDLGVKSESQIISELDGNEVIEGYRRRKKDPMSNVGLLTTLDKIDEVFRGEKLGELMIIAAYVAQGKTTMAANMAYNGSRQRMNGMYVSLEMNFDEMRDIIYCLHTSNEKWFAQPKFKNLAGKISYEKIRYGGLTDLEQEFFETSCMDLMAQSNEYGELHLRQGPPGEHLTPGQLEMDLYDLRAQLADKGKTLDYLVVDYVGLMAQDKSERYGDFNVDLNNIIKKLKNLTINFDNGRGLRIITPFQVNRDGWKEAVKNEGIYRLTALSNANEAERAADHIITLFMDDDMKKAGIVKIVNLKNRKGPTFDPFEACINLPTRKIMDMIHKKSDAAADDMAIQEIATDIGTI